MIGLIFVALVIVAILVTPPFWSVHKIGTQAVFNFFKQDAFYYLAIAARSSTGFYTFDGDLPTSGFHPLWQALLTGLFNAFPEASQEDQIYFVFALSVLLTTLGYVLAGFAVYTITRSKLLAILVAPGLFYLAFSFVTPFENSPWSYMNGMESSVSILLGGCLFVLISVFFNDSEYYSRRKSFFFILGLVLAMTVVARLDDVFLLAAFGLCSILMGRPNFRDRLLNTIVLLLPSIAILLCYVAFNRFTVGTYLPISGLAKGGVALADNIRHLFLLSGLQPFPLRMNEYVQFFEIYYRHIQMLFPMLLSVLFILVMRCGGDDFEEFRNKGMFFVALLLYVIFKGLYNLCNVHANHQGISWYYPLSIMTVNVAALILLSRAYRRYAPASWLIRVWAVVGLSLFLAVHVITATATTMNIRTHGSRVFAFWKGAQDLASDLLSKRPDLKLVEFDDGFMTYSLGIPAVHGIGFVLDYDGFKAKKEGRFLDYCYGRGFDTIASMQYLPVRNARLSSDQIRRQLRKSRFFGKEDLNKYAFEVLLVDKRTGAAFIRFKPKTE